MCRTCASMKFWKLNSLPNTTTLCSASSVASSISSSCSLGSSCPSSLWSKAFRKGSSRVNSPTCNQPRHRLREPTRAHATRTPHRRHSVHPLELQPAGLPRHLSAVCTLPSSLPVEPLVSAVHRPQLPKARATQARLGLANAGAHSSANLTCATCREG